VSDTFGFSGWRRHGAGNAPVPRQALTLVRLPMPEMRTGQLRQAVRLQLGQYAGGAAFAFVCRRQTGGQVLAWMWPLTPTSAGGPSFRAQQSPEPLLEAAGSGLRLLRRDPGYEAQYWRGDDLLHSRWFAKVPDTDDWQQFARGCGQDPANSPLPNPEPARRDEKAGRGWIIGNSLPARDPWQGWHWQAALLILGALAAAGAGFHWQTRRQLSIENQRLDVLRSERELAIKERAKHDDVAAELQSLRALTPQLLQLELLDRVSASGIFTKPVTTASATAPNSPASAPAATARLLAPTGAQLVEWDFRNGQLRMTLELANTELTLLDITRRLERVPGLGPLRVGQDSSNTLLTLSAAVQPGVNNAVATSAAATR
jgi:hypothetical protein